MIKITYKVIGLITLSLGIGLVLALVVPKLAWFFVVALGLIALGIFLLFKCSH